MKPSLLQKIFPIQNKHSLKGDTRISFSITFDYPDKIESNLKFRAVGKRGNTKLYSILAPLFSHSDLNIVNKVKEDLVSDLVEKSELGEISIDQAKKLALEKLLKFNTSENRELLASIVAHDTVGYGPFSLLMEDSSHIEEIIVNSPSSNIEIYHTLYGYCKTNLVFRSEREFRYMLNKMIEATGKEINSASPIIDAQLPDGSRVHAQISPYAIRGTSASIRLSGTKKLGIKELIRLNTLNEEILAYLWMSINMGMNIIIAGAPSSGKTTLLSALTAFILPYKRVITIEEDVNELRLSSNIPNNVALQGSTKKNQVHLSDQIVNALHMRPDMLIIGEVRGKETKEIFFGANVGIPFATTIHSNLDKIALINRLVSKPMSVEPQSLCALDLAIMMDTIGLNERKVSKIIEYKWLARGEVKIEEAGEKGFMATEIVNNNELISKNLKKSKVILKYANVSMSSKSLAIKELNKRITFLKKLALPENENVSASEFIRKYGAFS